MPTAQSTSSNPKTNNKAGDNKIAKAVAKVAEAERKESVIANQQQATAAAATVSDNQPSGGNKTPQEQPEFIKQSLILIEKKVRNLEKRRIKLDEYKATQKKGTPLNEDQLQAVEKYDEVIRTLELARELEKQFIGFANDAVKQQKKQAKKEQIEREEAIKEKLKETHKIMSLLDQFADENIRDDFLNERSGASKISNAELNFLDEFNRLVAPTELGTKLESLSTESAEHLYSLIEGKNKPVQWATDSAFKTSITYTDLKKLLDRLFASAYWNKEAQEQAAREAAATAAAAAEAAVAAAAAQQQQAELEQQQQRQQQEEEQQRQAAAALAQQINNLAIEQQSHQYVDESQQSVYQQNTSDDYVLVNPNDYPHHDNSQQQQQHQQKTAFFSTLNPAETRNINEFLTQSNDDNAINFLQDSELTAQQKHEQQQQQESANFHQSQQEGGHHRDNRSNRNNNYNNNNSNRSVGDRNYQQPRPRFQEGGNSDQRRGGGKPRDNNQPRQNNGGGDYRGPAARGGPGGNGGGYRGGNSNYNSATPRNGPGSNARPAYQQYNQSQNSQVAQ